MPSAQRRAKKLRKRTTVADPERNQHVTMAVIPEQPDDQDSDQLVAMTTTPDTPSDQAFGEIDASDHEQDTAEAPKPVELSPEAKKARAATTRRKQMKALLLKYHWQYHGPEEPLADGGIWAAVIQPRTQVEQPTPESPVPAGAVIRCTITPVPGSRASYENPENHWWTPDLPTMLGFPIKVGRWPFQEGEPGLYNNFVHSLFLGVDPLDYSFAKYTHVGWMGDALVVRTDGQDLCDQQLEVLLHYINDVFSHNVDKLFAGMKEGDAKEVTKQLLAEKYLCPHAFHAYFQEFKREKIANGRAYEGAKSPVEMTLGKVDPCCGICYSRIASGGQSQCCGKCEKRYYCSESCKAKDEEKHNKICIQMATDSDHDSNMSVCGESTESSSDSTLSLAGLKL